MYDIIIIGGGPAGLNAALYAGRGGMKTLLIERMFCGGQAATTYEIENYIGFSESLSGPDLMMRMETHAKRFGAEIINGDVTALELDGAVKKIHCDGKTYESKTVILCMGAQRRTLGLAREDALRGSGVSYCATCDGAFFRGRDVAVVGGGNAAVEEAIFLSHLCAKVYLIHRRDKLRAVKSLSDKLFEEQKVQLVWDTVVTAINGDGTVEGITVKNVKTGQTGTIPVNALFICIGTDANTDLIKDVLPLDGYGHVITNEEMATKIPGVFAAGDIRQKPLRQVITAVADGAVAADSAINYILES